MAPSFSLAALRVLERFERRFNNDNIRVDITGIKSRWYERKLSHVKRERLGKRSEKDLTESS